MSIASELNLSKPLPSIAAQHVLQTALDHREETEELRRLAPAVVEKLKDSELFRMGLPSFLGGWENNPVETLKAYEALSSAETSVAWIVWNNHLACTFGRYLDKESMTQVYNDQRHVYANSTRPEGMAKIVPGGYEVSGRWTLVSGCQLADWFVLRCRISEDGEMPELGPGTTLKLLFLPKSEISIIDTWKVGGLRGTGSHDIEVKNAFVPENLAVGFDTPIEVDTAYTRLPVACINAAGNGAMSLGLLKAAIDALSELCAERITPGKNPDLRDRQTVQATMAKAKTTLKSNRRELHEAVNVLWAEAEKGNTYTDEQLADVWAAAYNAATNAKELVTEIFSVAGTAALYTKFRFERIHRDIHGVLQHGIVQPHWMNLAGMAYVGLTPPAPMFRT